MPGIERGEANAAAFAAEVLGVQNRTDGFFVILVGENVENPGCSLRETARRIIRDKLPKTEAAIVRRFWGLNTRSNRQNFIQVARALGRVAGTVETQYRRGMEGLQQDKDAQKALRAFYGP